MGTDRFLRLPFSAQSKKSDFLLGALFSSFHVILVTIVYHYVPEPYMDEIFHIGQTRSYCDGNFTWNPLITTPPALYLISMPLCGYERYMNSILLFFAVPAFCRFRRMFSRENVWLTCCIVSCLPILLQSSHLFYTDLLSLTTVMWGFSTSNIPLAALFFTIATLCRQTNIVWAAIYSFTILCMKYNHKSKISSILSSIFSLWPFECLALGFISFIYFNNFQIVLGDAKAHEPKFHVAQLFYMLIFSTAHSWPQVLRILPTILKGLLNIRSCLSILIIGLLVSNFTYSHPYLLADNRHFTFYIWKRLLSKPVIRISLAPIYLLSARFMYVTTPQVNTILKFLFLFASALVLIPAHLFEMRYYIIPYIIWRLSVSTDNRNKSFLFIELASQLVIFSCVFILFIFYGFKWENEPQSLQRFMF